MHTEYQKVHMSLAVLRGQFDTACAQIASGGRYEEEKMAALLRDLSEQQRKLLDAAALNARLFEKTSI